ncbi:tRNA (adenosine(37)-N6)-threonylcarbamoyltransferase complex dimerization subunit type 1 TsaB [Streptococcus minor]|uniref:tRNA (Adenosine(37)-N6)-threonylcarbamoyltransferase complex dimerization subunit type 1 TsaB n=1 Tax=Streptococcus minor TaxID=229549 RepID=A0A3P1VCT8_9STRE|nr:tRNA (adenosine(37)-N6)-threonylcarbamoyltransferase complex dimerization subunit type 1 TsaB [Streptococcus minor]RRD31225.1 tRNA (adenosine(37)-N6)-threonylcarbamoyltransferase complex dimerization subunit type 1 TsaB [Streptococcus minor]
MKILAMDTSSQALAVALLDAGSLVAEVTLNIKKNHSISLMPAVDFLVESVGWKPTDLDRIVVAQGPGSYTGLRVAVATAKTLAYALKIELVGVSSLYALTAGHSLSGLVVPIMDARRNHVYAGFYDKGQAVMEDAHLAFVEVLERVASVNHVTFVGEVAHFRSQIEAYLPQASIVETLPSAFEIGKLGQHLPATPVDAFVPHYLKRVEAEENWLKNNLPEAEEDYIKRV